MSNKQTRKSISVALELYRRAESLSAERSISIAQLAAQGLEALLSGALPLAPAVDPRFLAHRTQLARGQVPNRRLPQPTVHRADFEPRVLVPREAFARAAAPHATRHTPLAAVASARGLSSVVSLPVSDVLHEAVWDQVERSGDTPGSELDAGIGRMLDRVEAEARAGAFCRACLEGEMCRCNGSRRAGAR